MIEESCAIHSDCVATTCTGMERVLARLQAALASQIDTISGLGASVLERDAEIVRLQTEVEKERAGKRSFYELMLQAEAQAEKAEAVVRAAERLRPLLRWCECGKCEYCELRLTIVAYRERA